MPSTSFQRIIGSGNKDGFASICKIVILANSGPGIVRGRARTAADLFHLRRCLGRGCRAQDDRGAKDVKAAESAYMRRAELVDRRLVGSNATS